MTVCEWVNMACSVKKALLIGSLVRRTRNKPNIVSVREGEVEVVEISGCSDGEQTELDMQH